MKQKRSNLRRLFMQGLLLVLIMAITACAAPAPAPTSAAGTSAPAAQTAAPATAAPAPKENFNPEGYPIVDEKITLTAMFSIDDRHDINLDTQWCLTRLEDQTNIHIEYDNIKSGDFQTISNLMFASGDYPDIIMGGRSSAVDIEEYGVAQSILIPIDDLMDQYMPNYTGILEDRHRNMLKQTDGQIYAVGAIMEDPLTVDPKMYINQKWLGDLGLSKPTTVSGLTDTLRVFKDSCPDGYPSSTTFTAGTASITASCFSFWGVPGHAGFMLGSDGKVQHVTKAPGYREAIEWVHMLYTDELIDPEFLTQSASVLAAKCDENNIGMTVRYSQYSSITNPEFSEDMVPLVPINAEGYQQQIRRRATGIIRHSVITVANEHLPETMRWFDAWFQSDAFMYESTYGPEGVTWEWVDGKMTNFPDTPPNGTEYGIQTQNAIYYFPAAVYERVITMDTNVGKAVEAGMMYEAANSVEEIPLDGILSRFVVKTPEETERWSLINADITKLIDETLAAFVVSGVTDQSWQAFLDGLAGAGIDELTDIAQGIYDRY
ncbi:MAG: extracellular solute-binding protein [Christensenellales bacterium]|jgi:putative aldouronate transport system substrate-binding protein